MASAAAVDESAVPVVPAAAEVVGVDAPVEEAVEETVEVGVDAPDDLPDWAPDDEPEPQAAPATASTPHARSSPTRPVTGRPVPGRPASRFVSMSTRSARPVRAL